MLKGEQLGPYRVLRRLGIGGMAEVYEALEPSGRAVALKVMRPDVRRASSVAMFVQEARIAQELDHEHIVRVESYGEIDGEHYMVMELVDGWTLEEAIELHRHAGERFSLGAAVDCAVQICRALSCVHELDPPIVHRDVTPHNVFVTTEGVVKLSDFGIAKQHGGPSLTVTGQIKGKLAYLAPEQATGEPLTARSDLYLVGLVLFELSTGERYVQTKDAVEAIMAAQRPTWRAPSSLRAEARVLDGILRRVLQRQPTLRFASARKLGDTLARLLVHLDGRAEDLVAHLRQLDASLPDGMAGSFEAAPTSVEPSVTSIDPYASSAIEAASAPHLEALATRPSAPTVLHESDSLVALGHDDQSRVRGGIETRFSARELQTVPRARAAAPRRQPGSLTMQLSGMADGQASDDRQAMARTRLKVSVGVLALGLVVLAVGVGLYIGSSGSGAGGGAGERRGLGSAAATAAGDGAVGRRSRPRAVFGALADAAQLDGTGRSADPAPIHDSDSDGGGRGTGVAGGSSGSAGSGGGRAHVAARATRRGRRRRRRYTPRLAKPPAAATQRDPAPGSASTPPRADAARTEARRQVAALEGALRRRGIYRGDDDALQRLLEAARKTPSQQTIERAATAARALRVDRAFAERKLRRLSSAIRRARLDAEDRARFDRITKRILRAILDGRFVSASHEMQRALHRLRALR